MEFSQNAKNLINLIEQNGYEAYEVGGCVRDYLMNRNCLDIDITSSAKPDELEQILKDNKIKYFETGIRHGTITVLFGGESFEVTTYRTDGEYTDFRHPSAVNYTTSLEDDLSRRDFTMNALAYNPSSGIVDMFSGRADIENKIIRAVGDPDKRFKEDALRIMRAIRFSSVLGFDIEEKTKKALFDNKELLNHISAERIFAELSKLLLGKNVFAVLKEYRDILAVFMPEIKPCFDFPQNTDWHIYDVWEHTCKAVEVSPDDLALRMIMLLHDIGKPFVRVTDENGTDHFKGHQKVSADMAGGVLKRLKVSNELYNRVMFIIPIHDMHIGTQKTKIKKWLAEIGENALRDLIEVKRADKLAQNPEKTGEELVSLQKTQKLLDEIISGYEPFSLKDLDINGYDLMKLGLKGKEIGETLNAVLQKVISGELENKKENIIDFVKKQRYGG